MCQYKASHSKHTPYIHDVVAVSLICISSAAGAAQQAVGS
jgi:hypothetical protein